ncbi:SMR family transporter [Aliisedimentitalea scapharcae]|uniref:SMR family transporter n=1 Tax=Aliisedimentitalea scapharcae TaxID=1524259 RepID=A0ABZ2XN98_9RHOB|nr:QacE family quaternary ammonium compound efflux SMR transporter [Rhodobacteraceae bacterium M382]
MPVQYLYLFIAVAAETIGTTALQASQQFSRLGPSLIVIVAYAFSFYMMGLTLKLMPVGIVYAIWSGLGIVLIAAIGFVVFGQKLDLPAVLGMVMIVLGILVIHLFSNSSTH